MNTLKKHTRTLICFFLLTPLLSGCIPLLVDYQYTPEISGTVYDTALNPVAGTPLRLSIEEESYLSISNNQGEFVFQQEGKKKMVLAMMGVTINYFPLQAYKIPDEQQLLNFIHLSYSVHGYDDPPPPQGYIIQIAEEHLESFRQNLEKLPRAPAQEHAETWQQVIHYAAIAQALFELGETKTLQAMDPKNFLRLTANYRYDACNPLYHAEDPAARNCFETVDALEQSVEAIFNTVE